LESHLTNAPRGLLTPDVWRVCSKTVMDNSDPDIRFDADGVSNWWHDFQALRARYPDAAESAALLEKTLATMKAAGRGKPYDCILGISGGVDSSYLAYMAKQWGLRPLVVHFDNGWNDELAVANIEAIVNKLNFRLQTFVMNWPEFRDLQRAYFKASVIDLDVPTDHMIFGALFRIAREHDVKYLLSGNNYATEWVLPRAWHYMKGDAVNLKAIHSRFAELPIKHLPVLAGWRRLYYEKVREIQMVQGLELVAYRKTDAKKFLMKEFGWQDYGGKHYESVFTRFYQGCFLPEKYGIDKRKAHLSNLILNDEITRDEAIAELRKPTYEPDRQEADKRYVAKKLGWSDAEFEDILALPPVPHEHYGTDADQQRAIRTVTHYVQPFAKFGRALLRV
jgi:N-acetyl sugar amidotransferase